MPYYKDNIVSFNWNDIDLEQLNLCIKQIVFTYYSLYFNNRIFFNNINIYNILINKLKKPKTYTYNINYCNNFDEYYKLNYCEYEILFNDFENCTIMNDDVNFKNFYHIFITGLYNIFIQLANTNNNLLNYYNTKKYIKHIDTNNYEKKIINELIENINKDFYINKIKY